MKAAVYHGRRDVRIESVPEPGAPRAGELQLKVVSCAICGTDASEYAHGPRLIPLAHRHPGSGHRGPVILGHEFVGRVSDAGPAVDEPAIDELVVPGASAWCGTCSWCRRGRTNLCERFYTIGLQADGGLAEYVNVPAKMCRRVPASSSADAAALAQPLAVAIHAVTRAGVSPGESVAVVGVGGIGLFAVLAARALGALPVLAVDLDATRLERARRLNATHAIDASAESPVEALLALTDGRGADVVVEATGASAGLATAQRSVARGGRLVLVGLHGSPRELDLSDLVLREVDVVTSLAHVCDADLPRALALLADEQVAAHATARRISLEALVDEGLAPLADRGISGKVVVRIA
jgi:(R,R)-butanediol dehydrogenase / meso-butanediol dehydrogenase / diacetyl reductase